MSKLMRYRPIGGSPDDSRLGRFIPDDWEHLSKYRLADVQPETVTTVERKLHLPRWHWTWDQGQEGACVGFGCSMVLSILREHLSGSTHRYDPLWLWNEAKVHDGWPETNPGDQNGTSVRAGYGVLSAEGHVRVVGGTDRPVSLAEGINEYRWATSVDQMRTAVANGMPLAIGVNWYENFDNPAHVNGEDWIGRDAFKLGRIRGGHCLAIYAASDRRQAFCLKNSWGRQYPLVWLPYNTMNRLLTEDGEVGVISSVR